MIRTNTLKVLRVTRERKVGIITNTNDTYEYIEDATSNQEKKDRNYNIHIHIYLYNTTPSNAIVNAASDIT